MSATGNARRLRRKQTPEEKELWQSLRAGRFAGFKFRRQHSIGPYLLDIYCPMAKLAVELDGYGHGLPERRAHDEKRRLFLEAKGIEELRYWNHQWRQNRDGVLIEIWAALHERTGCTAVVRMSDNNRFVPPEPTQIK